MYLAHTKVEIEKNKNTAPESIIIHDKITELLLLIIVNIYQLLSIDLMLNLANINNSIF